MRKRMHIVTALLLSAVMLAGCGGTSGGKTDTSSAAETSSAAAETSSAAAVSSAAEAVESEESTPEKGTISATTKGKGYIAIGFDGVEPEIDMENPVSDAGLTSVVGSTFILKAEPAENWMFEAWEKDGKLVSEEAVFEATLADGDEYVAVFGAQNGQGVTTDMLKTVEDVRIYTDPEMTAITGNQYVAVFNLGGTYYRAFADLPEGMAEQLYELPVDDPKEEELLAPLEIVKVENLSAQMLGEDERVALEGKTGEDLLNDGWTYVMCNNLDPVTCTMYKGPFVYEVTFVEAMDAEPDAYGDLSELKILTVASVTYQGLGDATNLKYEE